MVEIVRYYVTTFSLSEIQGVEEVLLEGGEEWESVGDIADFVDRNTPSSETFWEKLWHLAEACGGWKNDFPNYSRNKRVVRFSFVFRNPEDREEFMTRLRSMGLRPLRVRLTNFDAQFG